MLARLIKDKDDSMCILCSDGTIIPAEKNALNHFLSGFHTIEKLGNGVGRWDKDFPEITLYPGHEYACVADTHQLIISDFSPFRQLFEVNAALPNMITAAAYAKLHGRSVEQIKVLCRRERIAGAIKMGRDWLVPSDAPYPVDQRFTYRK